jgi:hypothetical protein
MNPKLIRVRVFDAAIETAKQVGPLPHEISDDIKTKWLKLIREYDQTLVSVPDQIILRELVGND